MNDRLDSGAGATAWAWAEYLLIPAQRRLLHRGEPVDVEDRTIDLLILLLQHQERALDKQEVITAIWGKRPVGDATLRQLVFKARRAVGDDGEHQHTISTLYGRSLQWVATVEAVFMPASTEPDAAGAPGEVAPAEQALVPERPSPQGARPRTRMPWLLAEVLVLLAVCAVAWWQHASVPRQHAVVAKTPAPAAAPAKVATPAVPANGRVTVAVLPFLGMDRKGDSYLADGLTEELITRLGSFRDLRVAARTSSFVFRDKPVDIREAARQLGVANVVEGSVQRSGDRLRIRVSLVGAKDGYQLWSAEYDPAAGDLLKVEDEIAAAVIKQLHPKLDANALAILHGMQRRTATNPAAHDFYLVGLQFLSRRTVPDIQQALLYFRRALQVDSGYAPAWSGVATAYNLLREHNSDKPPDTYYGEALAAAQKAVALDPQLGSAHLALALLHEAHWQWTQAEREYAIALRLDPSNPVAHQWYGAFQWYLQDPPKALAELRLAHDLDPLSPITSTDLARALLFNNQVDAAIAQFQATIKQDPGFALAHLLLAQAYLGKGRETDAVREARAAIALVPAPTPSSYLSVYGIALYFSGDKAGARKQLQILEARSRQHYVSGVSLALLQAQVGSRDEMFASLARAVADHDALMRPAVASHDSPWYGDPRFKALLVKMGLPVKH
ncbi:MAG TPA: tetratricopeptide repeat protein [Rhodanobacteraceae bacterium]|jgi:TolB-like protein/DNA-binding winged helix-turn-helix (wHTH) protein/Tfp pilus assembly protein PilF|nr:tetratricopeptide repeat protein [Rhodanobacteraceae bacterium]